MDHRIVQSLQCIGLTLNGNRCKRKTRKGDECWYHLQKDQGLRIKKSTIPNSGDGLFAAKEFKKDSKVVDYLGEISQEAIQGPFVLELGKHKFVDAAESKYVGGFSNTCRSRDHCTNNATLTSYKGVGRIKAKKKIAKGKEIFTSYGRNYGKQF